MEKDIKTNHEIEFLKLEYRECQNGYNSRDKMAEDEFCKVIQVFSIFLTILVAFSVFAKIGLYTYCAVCSLIGVTGLMCLVSLLVVIDHEINCHAREGKDSVKSFMTQARYSLKMPKKGTFFHLMALVCMFCHPKFA